ncbi:MAG: glycine zipper 2TM domain-containing protein [Burkholderiaceae bacterium]|nr:glycine zipper 2TM domain-containing protein [Burkholderiaceae bacterium]
MKTRQIAILCSFSALAMMTACSTYSPRYDSVDYMPRTVSSYSQTGSVVNIEVIRFASRSSGGGAVVGAVIGGVIGNQFGRGSGRVAATGLGAVSGAVIGNAVEMNNQGQNDIYRVSVRFDNGAVGQFDYYNVDNLRIGDRVRAEGGALYRF